MHRIAIVAPENTAIDDALVVPHANWNKVGVATTVFSVPPHLCDADENASDGYDLCALIGQLRTGSFDAVVMLGESRMFSRLWNQSALRDLPLVRDREGKLLNALCVGGAMVGCAGFLFEQPAPVPTPSPAPQREAQPGSAAIYWVDSFADRHAARRASAAANDARRKT